MVVFKPGTKVMPALEDSWLATEAGGENVVGIISDKVHPEPGCFYVKWPKYSYELGYSEGTRFRVVGVPKVDFADQLALAKAAIALAYQALVEAVVQETRLIIANEIAERNK